MGLKIAFLDCDGTLTKIKSSWEYLHRRLNIWDDVAMHYQELFRAGQIDYHEFCKRDATLWRGLKVEKVKEIIDEIEYREGAEELVEFLKSSDIITVIISTGLSLIVDKVKNDLGIDMALSNELISEGDILTGDVKINVEYNKKGGLVKSILKTLGINKENACALGDGEGDEGLFSSVNLSIMLLDDNVFSVDRGKNYFYCKNLYDAKRILERFVKKT